MKKGPLVTVVVLALVLATVPAVVGRHNSVGFWATVGSGAPSELNKAAGDSGAAVAPKYHTDVITGGRIPPADRAYRASWIGFLDGEFEYVPAFNVGGVAPVVTSPDPLYRANPAPGDVNCDSTAEQTDLSKCTGTGHELVRQAAVGVDNDFLDQGGRAASSALGRDTAAGTIYPGVYTPYVYLFGLPSPNHGSPVVTPGSGAFANVPANVCTPGVGRAGANPNWGGGACVLLNQNDLLYYSTQTPGDDVGNLCVENVQFHLATGAPPVNAPCGRGLHVFHSSYYVPEAQQGNYIVDRPGFRFLVAYLLGPKPGSILCTDSFTRCDVRDLPDWVAHRGQDSTAGHHGSLLKGLSFHYFVNPVPVDRLFPDLTCVIPSVGTDAGTRAGVIAGSGNYLYAAHDLDVMVSPVRPELQAGMNTIKPVAANPTVAGAAAPAAFVVNSQEDPVRAIDIINDQLIDPTLSDLLPDAVEAAVTDAGERAAVFQGQEAATEPAIRHSTAPEQWNTLPAGFGCTTVAAQLELVNDNTAYVGALRMDSITTYRDPATFVTFNAVRNPNSAGARDDATPYTAWHAGSRSLGGDVRGVLDANHNGALDPCVIGGRARLSFEDLCPWGAVWDIYNPAALLPACGTTTTTAAQCAQSRGYDLTKPNGMVQVWRITGPLVVTDEDVIEDVAAPDRSTDRTFTDLSSGPKCFVGYSRGFKGVLDQGVNAAWKAQVLSKCAGYPVVMEMGDTFDDQGTIGTFSSALNVLAGNAAPGDGVTVGILISTGAGGLNDDDANVELAAGQTLPFYDNDAFP